MSKAEAVALQTFDDSWENHERQCGFDIEMFLATQFPEADEQDLAHVARECARIAAVSYGLQKDKG